MQKRTGISLIVLVITIIVMIILAGAIILTLNNSGIIEKATGAVEQTNLATVKELAQTAWGEAYLDENVTTDDDYKAYVENKLRENGVEVDSYYLEITSNGIIVKEELEMQPTLGDLVTSAADYGKTVNYSANGVTDWKILYETEDYVYLIASEELAYDKVPKNIPEASVVPSTITLADNTTRTIGQIYWQDTFPSTAGTIQNASIWMANWGDYETNKSGRCVSYFLDETHWTAFKNTTADYAKYVVGAIGTPTAEMIVESWNSKREATNDTVTYNKKISLVANEGIGYYINDITSSETANSNSTAQEISTDDNLYIWSTVGSYAVRLASPSAIDTALALYCGGYIYETDFPNPAVGLRPVVCLSSKIPAELGTATDYTI